MFISQGLGNNCHAEKNEGEKALPKMETGKRKSVFGPQDDLEMLSWMCSAALDPFTPSSNQNLRKMLNQIRSVRKFMILSNTTAPQKKRKLDLFIKEQSTSLRSNTNEKISKMKKSSRRSSFGSSVSSTVNSVKSNGYSRQNPGSSRSSLSSLTVEDDLDGNLMHSLVNINNANAPAEDISLFGESNESANNSKDSPSGISLNYLPILDFDDSLHGSSSSNTEDKAHEYLKKPRQSKLNIFVGDYIPTMVVPVGTRFQANVPKWSGSEKNRISYDANDSESLKWLGNKMWPVKTHNSGSKPKGAIGKGRAGSCSCESPGSEGCFKNHILEQRYILMTYLGSAFYSMKLDEMGDEVAKKWSSSEQLKFKSFMKSARPSNRSAFWKNMAKSFPGKRRENVISYYFNVYVPKEIAFKPERLLANVDDASNGAAKKCLKQKRKYSKSKGVSAVDKECDDSKSA